MERTQPLFYRRPEGGYVRPIFKTDKFREIIATMPPSDDAGRAYGLALFILTASFGIGWVERHILSQQTNGYLARTEDDAYGAFAMHRVRDLAEMVLNLLPIDGVEAPLDQLVSGSIESAVAELATGKLLRRRDLPFRFVWPSGIRGRDFDLLVQFPNGVNVCADTKCKLEEKPFSASGFRNTLDGARKRNLPKALPGAIFVKIPADWFGDQITFAEMEKVIWEFLRQTSTIVCVQVYISVVTIKDNITSDGEQGWEYVNKAHAFGDTLDWRIFGTNRGVLPNAKGWKRLVDIVREFS